MAEKKEFGFSKELKSYIPIVEAIGKSIKIGEVLLYDFLQDPPLLIAKEGGLTSRPIGTKASVLLKEMVKEMESETQTMRINYESATRSGKPLKSTTILLKDENERLTGVLCLNIDVSGIDILQHFIDQFTGRERIESQDEMPQNAGEFLKIMIAKSISQITKPLCYFDKKDNIEVVRFLNKNHIFSIKGSVESLATELNVSRYTIYNYIEEVKGK